MQRPVFLLLALLASSLAQAQIYQWKDASGRTVFSDQPPAAGNAAPKLKTHAETPAAAPPPASGNQKSWAEKELEFRKRLADSREREEASRKESAQAEELAKDCARARTQLQVLESGQRVALPGPQGERIFIDDAQRQAEIERSKKAVGTLCK